MISLAGRAIWQRADELQAMDAVVLPGLQVLKKLRVAMLSGSSSPLPPRALDGPANRL
jgi:hypothetical protein